MYDNVIQVADELISAHLSGEELLSLKVSSNSMAPFLRSGDYVLLRPAPFNTLHPGDVIVTRQEGVYRTHRLVTIIEQSVLTKGDRNHLADAQTDKENIVGLVEAVERRGRIVRVDTRYQRFLARILGWLAQREVNNRSPLSIWTPRIIARCLLYLLR